jgi:hypothetical protein
MSSLQRSIVGVVRLLNQELQRLTLQEPEGKDFLEHAEITADYVNGRQAVGIILSYRNRQVWRRLLPISANQVEFSSNMSDEKLYNTITDTMRKHLNLVAQMHFARLDPMFPNSIDEVSMGYDPTTNSKTVQVKFKNGHVAEGPESEAKLDIFLARCAMLYDLPPLSR